jgi:hypothetical protein
MSDMKFPFKTLSNRKIQVKKMFLFVGYDQIILLNKGNFPVIENAALSECFDCGS